MDANWSDFQTDDKETTTLVSLNNPRAHFAPISSLRSLPMFSPAESSLVRAELCTEAIRIFKPNTRQFLITG